MTPLLEVDGASKRFGGVQALSNVTFAVEPGAFVGLIGANGAGKTTLFSMIAGHQRPTSGDIRLGGTSVVGVPVWRRSRLGIARTFQIMRPFRELTVRENVVAGALYGRAEGRTTAEAQDDSERILAELDLLPIADWPARTLTLGMQKRVEIARALATRPSLLLLDEVLSGLTPKEVEDAVAVLRAVQTRFDLTVIMVEHVLRAVMQLCQRVVVLHHGEKIAEGTPAQVTTSAAVIEAYLGTSA